MNIHVRSPKSDVPFIHEIGWWSHQKGLDIKRLQVKPIDSRLGLFNAKTLVSVEIEGKVKGDSKWRPVIAKVHLSERIIKGGQISEGEAEFALTPIVDVKRDESYSGESVPFILKQELILHSMNWGKNLYRFSAGQLSQDFILRQPK
jgi:hypothetical protein